MSGSRIRLARHWAPSTLAEDTLSAVRQEMEWCTRRMVIVFSDFTSSAWCITSSWLHSPGQRSVWFTRVDSNERITFPSIQTTSICPWAGVHLLLRLKTDTRFMSPDDLPQNQLRVSSWWTAVWKGALVSCKCAKVLTRPVLGPV